MAGTRGIGGFDPLRRRRILRAALLCPPLDRGPGAGKPCRVAKQPAWRTLYDSMLFSSFLLRQDFASAAPSFPHCPQHTSTGNSFTEFGNHLCRGNGGEWQGTASFPDFRSALDGVPSASLAEVSCRPSPCPTTPCAAAAITIRGPRGMTLRCRQMFAPPVFSLLISTPRERTGQETRWQGAEHGPHPAPGVAALLRQISGSAATLRGDFVPTCGGFVNAGRPDRARNGITSQWPRIRPERPGAKAEGGAFPVKVADGTRCPRQ